MKEQTQRRTWLILALMPVLIAFLAHVVQAQRPERAQPLPPDLEVRIYGPGTTFRGENIAHKLRVEVLNTGERVVPAGFVIDIFIRLDNKRTYPRLLGRIRSTYSVDAGRARTYSLPAGMVPTDIPAGPGEFYAYVDAEKIVAEIDEHNNSARSRVTVAVAARGLELNRGRSRGQSNE